jgi:hypothetical protein
VSFSPSDLRCVPEHWQTFGSRMSPLTRSSRLAVNPANAMLNYLYAVLESEARLAICELGLDPGIGVLHNDTRARDSLACDLMEPIRPQVDAYLLHWLRRAPLQRRWFFEKSDGNCRLSAELAGELSETSRMWRDSLAPLAEWIAHTLWSVASRPSRTSAPATRLTQTRKREAKGMPTGTAFTQLISREHLVALPQPFRLDRKDATARTRRAETQQRQASALKAWTPSDKPEWLDGSFYRERVLPRLPLLQTSAIKAALSISEAYAVKIRAGRCIPHPRHWLRLNQLVGSSSEPPG